MSDPVDTDALRGSADALQYVSGDQLEWLDDSRIQSAQRNLKAAAEELDELRTQLNRFDEIGAYAALRGELSSTRVRHSEWAQKSNGEIAKLRAMIGNAPHAIDCASGLRGQRQVSCTCWKSRA